MKILIDINHPAHVHYFRNFIKIMESKGHEFCIVNRDSKMINQLLDYYKIEHVIRNKRPEKSGSIASILNLLTMIWWCIRVSFKFHPDFYVGFGSAVCSVTSRLFFKPCFVLDDTEFNSINHKIYLPCVSAVLTPFYFQKVMGDGKKQYFFNGYVEQLYLHSKDFNKSNRVLTELGVSPNEYVVMRFTAYDAHHDIAIKHLNDDDKIKIIDMVSKKYRVFISFEKNNIPERLKKYQLTISPEKIHDLEANAKFMVTEGATMASEAFVLGIPYLFIGSSKPLGNIDYQCKNYPNRAFRTIEREQAFKIVGYLMDIENDRNKNVAEIEKNTERPTEYLQWFVENFPKSLANQD